MAFEYNFPLFSILLVMASALVMPLFKNYKIARNLHIAVVAAVGVFSLALMMRFMKTGGTFTYMMGHYPAPWGNELRFGLFESMMAALFSVVMLLAVIAGQGRIELEVKPSRKSLYYSLLNMLLASMLALIYTNDIFTAYVFIEINTIAACAIVLAKDSGESLLATLRYLVMSLLGSGLFLISVAIIYSITGHLLFSSLQTAIVKLGGNESYRIPLMMAGVLMTFGLCVKSAVFPFHTWLADAHSSTTTASSSILSGLVVKSYIILLVKIYYRVLGVQTVESTGLFQVIFVLGILGMMFGSFNALKEKESKRMIAYSSVAQIGYIFMGLGLGNVIGLSAAFFHLIAHAFTKPLLFLAESGLSDAAGHSRLNADLTGAGYKNRIAGISYVVGAFSMVGIPLFAGFTAKWYMAGAAFQMPSKTLPALIALAISTCLNAMYYLPVVLTIYKRNPGEAANQGAPVQKPAFAYVTGAVCLIAANIALGVLGHKIFQMLQFSMSVLA